jgi:excisionase family DNA binding protein
MVFINAGSFTPQKVKTIKRLILRLKKNVINILNSINIKLITPSSIQRIKNAVKNSNMSIEKDLQEIKEFAKELVAFQGELITLNQRKEELPVKYKIIAKEMGISERTVYEWMKQGIIPRYKIGGTLLAYRSDIKALLGTNSPPLNIKTAKTPTNKEF